MTKKRPILFKCKEQQYGQWKNQWHQEGLFPFFFLENGIKLNWIKQNKKYKKTIMFYKSPQCNVHIHIIELQVCLTYLISGSELFVLGAVLLAETVLLLQILSNPDRCRMFSIKALSASSVFSLSNWLSVGSEPAPPGWGSKHNGGFSLDFVQYIHILEIETRNVSRFEGF